VASRKASNDPSYSIKRDHEAADDPSDDAGEKRRTGGERDT
jgi:hypothetical protein